MMTLEEALAVADRLEGEDCIGTTSQALRAVARAYTSLLDEYHTYEKSMEGKDLSPEAQAKAKAGLLDLLESSK